MQSRALLAFQRLPSVTRACRPAATRSTPTKALRQPVLTTTPHIAHKGGAARTGSRSCRPGRSRTSA
eukprot:4382591-Prymnesium_polylepis.1